ncbi:hypothetical protein HMN09_01035300 [Mycena chlorophos]|uniref:Uncharacterized protein n=1 Tax=Mycena chlorophos TaxID=658473 RepID=A0A8H6VXX1_MYCCL|nr:hypothetical protein HMN09_01035300 [Mycena chlorophos]
MPPKSHRRIHSRTNSAGRLPITALTQKKSAPPRQPPAPTQRPPRPGFHIATHADDDEDESDEEEEWTSESGAVTPNPVEDDDEADSDVPPELPRIATARAADYFGGTGRVTPDSPQSIRRHSRPMSAHSMNRLELMHKPHPLIRGASFGQPCVTPKPSPLLPVAVTLDATTDVHLTASPTRAYPESPPPSPHPRRTSISSVHSVATVATQQQQAKSRHRTFSTMSSSSAVSSLQHLPPVVRPAPYITLFPPSDPQQDNGIHPLLPPPYVANHLTVVTRRAPIRDALDRILRARESART